ncbi:hypothetical protein JAAARDRAFT_643890 [Jaapia argillacea MUCL 33604]|uniref:F-box domain-containing protein n=1 Tax=Jaapia argillacea MUCL 33604 TaxID=933084 RepID=A0A067PEQ0_9AGAM|nr:hypothetical protein JAAARDRAFT_643890 [Jaapia argillacea MUCL 33604]
MVQTRWQSGKLPPPRYAPAAVASVVYQLDDEDGDEHDGLSSDLTEFESDEEDKDPYNGPPMRKRAKTTASQSASTSNPTAKAATPRAKVVRKKRIGKLSMLPQMPLDILFEIFVHLTPKDLLNLSRTDKLLRKTLLSRKSLSIWKNVRLAAEVPDGPDGMSEPAWAEMVFGTTCQNCGAKGVTNIDFAIQKRCCPCTCRSFREEIPRFQPGDNGTYPYTTNGGWAHGHASSSKFFWEDDVHIACKALATYQKAAHMRTPGAKAALDGWKESKMEEVTRIVEAAKVFDLWVIQQRISKRIQGGEIAMKRVADIISRLVALGWDKGDVERLRYRIDGNSNNKKELTNRGFAMIKPGLEATLAEFKAQRIEKETKARLEARTQLLSAIYFDYKKTLPIKEWAFIPRWYDFLKMREVKELVDRDEVLERDCLELEVMERLFREWTEVRRAKIEALISDLGPGSTDYESGQIVNGQAFPVFLCTNKGCMNVDPTTLPPQSDPHSAVIIGIESAVAHRCRNIMATPFHMNEFGEANVELAELRFCKRGGEVVEWLLKTVGLDVVGGDDVIGEMDRVDARFTCEGCLLVVQNGVSGKLVKTWRQC